MFIVAGLLLLLAMVLFVLCFFQPTIASRTFVALFILGLQGFCGGALLVWRKKKVGPELAEKLTPAEVELVEAYPLYFTYPGTMREFSMAIAGVGLAAFVFVPLLFWKEHYLEATIIAANWYLAGPLSHKLSPMNGLIELAKRGDFTAQRRVEVWDSTVRKILEYRRDKRRATKHKGN